MNTQNPHLPAPADMVAVLREFVAAHKQTPFGERFRSEAAFLKAQAMLDVIDKQSPEAATPMPDPIAVGDTVRVQVPASHHDEKCVKYNGQAGTVEEISEADENGPEMISVRFADGYRDGFYDDELVIVSRAKAANAG